MKLSDVAKSWDSNFRTSLPVRNNTNINPRDHHSLHRWMEGELTRNERSENTGDDRSAKSPDALLSSIFTVVKAVGLFLIIRKVENMFQ